MTAPFAPRDRRPDDDPRHALAAEVASAALDLAGVRAVALGGSLATGMADGGSDIDLYVYADTVPEVSARAALAEAMGAAPGGEVGNAFFEPGDEWTHAATGIEVDLMYRTPAWADEVLTDTYVRHRARLGYSTCFWHNLRTCRPLADPAGWMAGVHGRAQAPYPERLARAVIDLNWRMLQGTAASWLAQLEGALARGDAVAASHRTSALLASWFDVLFAANRAPHPGEKRLMVHAASLCPRRPEGMGRDVPALIAAAGRCDPAAAGIARRLTDGLERFALTDMD